MMIENMLKAEQDKTEKLTDELEALEQTMNQELD
jgi:hypothetical protein